MEFPCHQGTGSACSPFPSPPWPPPISVPTTRWRIVLWHRVATEGTDADGVVMLNFMTLLLLESENCYHFFSFCSLLLLEHKWIICQFSSSSWIFLLLFSIDDDDRGEEFKGALLAFLKAVLSTTGAAGCGVQV